MQTPDPSHEDPDDFADLERQLSRLVPAPPGATAQRRIGRQLDDLASRRRETRQMWWRFAPVAVAACATLVGVALLRSQFATSVQPDGAPRESLAISPNPAPPPVADPRFISPPPVGHGIPAGQFVPVSSQEILREAREGGVIELPDRRRAREIRVEYDDAWHWHDPATQTNVRIFRPREEIFLVPVETD